MLTREQRATKGAMWLAHWQGWQNSGVSMQLSRAKRDRNSLPPLPKQRPSDVAPATS
jgi:hypothetical protein